MMKTSCSTKHNQHYSTQDCRVWLDVQFGFGCACLMWCHATSFLVLDLWFSLIRKSDKLLLPNPRDQELEFHPCVNLHREKLSASVELCQTEVCFLHIQLVSTNVRLPKVQRMLPDVDLSLASLLQNQNPEINLIGIVVLYFPHSNIV